MNTTTNIITSLIGTCVGGAISYLVIYQSEKNKRKKEFELKAACKVLIPLGDDLENLIFLITNEEFLRINLEIFFKELNKLSIYLNIKKSFFLNQDLKVKISKYLIMVNLLNENLTAEYNKSFSSYKSFILKKLLEFDSEENVNIEFNSNIEKKLKKIILIKKPHLLNELIDNIDFIEFEKKIHTKIDIDEDIRALYVTIKIEQEDLENIPTKSYNLLEFFYKKIIPYEKKEIEKIVSQTKSSEDLKKILIYLKNLKKDVVENIDKVKT